MTHRGPSNELSDQMSEMNMLFSRLTGRVLFAATTLGFAYAFIVPALTFTHAAYLQYLQHLAVVCGVYGYFVALLCVAAVKLSPQAAAGSALPEMANRS
jgi:hypothetical protein